MASIGLYARLCHAFLVSVFLQLSVFMCIYYVCPVLLHSV